MNMSKDIDKIAPALVAIQDGMVAVKDAKSVHSAKYATLGQILKCIRPKLKEHALTVIQTTDTDGKRVTCTTRVLHESGQFFDSAMSLDAAQLSPQGYGSAVTYARRYSLCTALSIATPDEEDDDGLEATIETAKVEISEQEQIALDKYKVRAFPNFMKFDVEPMSVSFESGGFVSKEIEKELWLRDVLKQVDSKEKLDFIGKDAAKRQEEFDATTTQAEL